MKEIEKNVKYPPPSTLKLMFGIFLNITTIFAEDPDVPSSDDEHRDTVNIETWLNKPDVKHAFTCRQVRENGYMCPR